MAARIANGGYALKPRLVRPAELTEETGPDLAAVHGGLGGEPAPLGHHRLEEVEGGFQVVVGEGSDLHARERSALPAPPPEFG